MLTPEYLSWITDKAEEVASSLFSRILNKIIERIFARFKRQDDYVLTSVDKHNIDTLQEAGYLLDDIQKEIVEATGIEAKVIKEAFEDAGIEGMEIDAEVYDQVGIEVPDLTESPAAVRAMQRNYEATMGEWKNLTGTTAIDADNKFIETCDEAFTNVNSGAMGLDQAIKEAIDKLVEEGITAVHYASGRTDSIDVAIARAVRTGIAQAAAQVTLTRMKEMGVDLLITSAHLGARPSHEAWQGQIFHVDWSTIDIYRRYTKDDSVPAPNTASKYPDFVQSTRFGFVDGLCGANCRHSFSPYFEGMPNPYADFDNKKSREIYKLEQKQRAMERAIRKTKREKAAYKTALDNAPTVMKAAYKEEYDKRVEKLRNQSQTYNLYCVENQLRPLESRLINHFKDIKGINTFEIRSNHGAKAIGIITSGSKMSRRQQTILDMLPEFGSTLLLRKKDICMGDLAVFSAITGDEFSMFTNGSKRLIMRGAKDRIPFGDLDAKMYHKEGWKWSGHTHPIIGAAFYSSYSDRQILKCFEQEKSVIYDSKGNFSIFTADED